MINAQAYEVFDMKMLSKALLMTGLLLFMVPVAQAAEDQASARDRASEPTLVNARKEARPGRTTEMYRVPGGMELLVSQTCVPHPAVQVELGRDRQELSYSGAGCTRFGAGMRVGGGEAIYCTNRAGTAQNCMLIGMLRDDPNRGDGALFIDVDKAVADNK